MDKKLLGYRNGFVYYQIKNDVFRGDYGDTEPILRWYSTLNGMLINIKAYGLLYDARGNEIQVK